MTLLEFFQWFEYSSLLVEMRSSPWMFPVIATFHLFGLSIIGGAVLLVDLRLLGVGLVGQPPERLADNARPILLSGLAIMFPTGLFLFMCFATKYYYLAPFWAKLAAITTVLVYTFVLRPKLLRMEPVAGPVVWPKLLAVISLSLWFSVALGGRLIGFP